MIDTEARNKLAEEIRHFVECFTTNYEFDDAAFEIRTKDIGVKRIYENIWFLYDDLKEHKLNGKWELAEEQKDIIKRCILFLKTNNEYKWRERHLFYKLTRPILWLFSLGLITKKIDSYYDEGFDYKIWPFSTKVEYESALLNPVYLNNAYNKLSNLTGAENAPSS